MKQNRQFQKSSRSESGTRNVHQPSVSEKGSFSFCQKLGETIEEHLNNPMLSVPFLAKHLCISERQIYRNVKLCSSLTPNQYIQKHRIEKAMKLLQSGQFAFVKDIAVAVGYSKESYFSNLFAKQFGKRPIEFLVNNKMAGIRS